MSTLQKVGFWMLMTGVWVAGCIVLAALGALLFESQDIRNVVLIFAGWKWAAVLEEMGTSLWESLHD